MQQKAKTCFKCCCSGWRVSCNMKCCRCLICNHDESALLAVCSSTGFTCPVPSPITSTSIKHVSRESECVCVCVHSYFCSLNTAAVCCHTVCTVYSCRSCCFLVRLVSSGTWFACQTPVGVCVCVRECQLCVVWWAFIDLEGCRYCSGGATTTHACAHTHSSLQVYFCVSPSLPWPYACGLFIFAIGL